MNFGQKSGRTALVNYEFPITNSELFENFFGTSVCHSKDYQELGDDEYVEDVLNN
ncbi:hypothetical protein [uncultured Fluviicola sp.]|uniref:hypothetical protein n=1 Tax=uncultured Fluviicola sp. TaxID=463303 RepID=UPI0025D3E235|nr:hypothetical protein [uncultured Fluviicola sp.]